MKKLLFQLLPFAIIALYGCQGQILPTPTPLKAVTATTNGMTFGTNISPSSIVLSNGTTTTSINTNNSNSTNSSNNNSSNTITTTSSSNLGNTTTTTSNPSTFSVTINGSPYSGKLNVDSTSNSKLLVISSTVYDYIISVSYINLYIPKNATVGSHVSDFTNYDVYYSANYGVSTYSSNNGNSDPNGLITVVISSVSGKTIKGTFSGSLSTYGTSPSVIPITNGSFSVTY